MNDLNISILLTIILACHLAILIWGYKTRKTPLLIAYFNAAFMIGMLVFRTLKSLKSKQYTFDLTELSIIGLEVVILIFALFYIYSLRNKGYVKVINYIGFGIHLLATTGLLLYISFFKFSRLY